jgi:alkylation response protein AidB-like acyl-CoA dehydrogenase
MTQASSAASVQRLHPGAPTVPELRRRLDELGPFFSEMGGANEAARTLVPEVFAKLRDLHLHKLLVPRSLGGIGATIIEEIELVETLAYADASTAWVVFAAVLSTGLAAGHLDDEAAGRIFAPDALGLIAGAGAPTGVAKVVEGGYLCTGRWSYGSGILHADWSHSGAFVHENGKMRLNADGSPEHIIIHVPLADVTLEGNWDVLGLRATGSVDYAVTEVFVPEAYVFPVKDAPARRRPEVFGLDILPIASIGHAAWAAGVGRRMLDELASYVRSKGLRAGSLAASDSFAERFGEAEARVRSARAFLYESWGSLQAKLQAGEQASTRDITLIRLALSTVTYAATEVGEFAYRIVGGEALRQGVLQRLYRDIHAGSQHITSSPAVMQACGRDLAGLAPDEVWKLNGLAKA